ncbi:Phosducin-like protein [Halotydeus destructor]|nr:Phosducin-like protein [Halotydeus destructor]
MATLDDKLLGEKLHYYCSSDEEEVDEGSEEKGEPATQASKAAIVPEQEIREWDGYSCNTGPKGVIKDWQRFKQLENEKKISQEAERLALMKKLTITCDTKSDEEKQQVEKIDHEMNELLNSNDPFFQDYVKKRMQEMLTAQEKIKAERRVFGHLIELPSGPDFLEAIDKEKAHVTIICHIYRKDIPACSKMNGCLRSLAADFNFVKFCSIEASMAGMSKQFESSGVPAILIYKNGNLLGNFVRITDDLTEKFTASDVEAYLVDHGYLPDQSCVPEIVSKSIRANRNDSDSE